MHSPPPHGSYLDNVPLLTNINKCSDRFCQIPYSRRQRTGPGGGRDHCSRARSPEAPCRALALLCDVRPRPRPLTRSQSKGRAGSSRRARARVGGRPRGPERWSRPFPASRLRPGRLHPRRGRRWAWRRSSMTVQITTTCVTSRPAVPGAARAGPGVSGNCAPTGRCAAATSARSHRSSSMASASVASASCSLGRAPVSPERRCVRAATGQDPRDSTAPCDSTRAQSPPSEAAPPSESDLGLQNPQLISWLQFEWCKTPPLGIL